MASKSKSLPITFIEIAIITTIGIVAVLFSIAFLNRLLMPFPSAEIIGRNYLDRVVDRDLNGIVVMTRNGDNRLCVENEARSEISKYGNAKVRNISVTTEPGQGSDDRLEWTIVKFDYQNPNSNIWQPGKITIMTNNRSNWTFLRTVHCIGA